MPELPEVETVLRTLEHRIKGQRINDVNIYWNNIIIGDPDTFKKQLIGQHFNKFIRRGKYLLFELDDIVLVSHLRMEGKYYIKQHNVDLEKHEHVVFILDDYDLKYHDTRKFGKMEIIYKQDNYDLFKNLGVEPLSNKLNYDYCKNYLKNSKKVIKAELLNQKFIAGIGNIYADEILFRIKVLPDRMANTLNKQEINDLVYYTKHILEGAIKAGGTTIKSYTSSLGVSGLFQLELKVHTKKGQPCLNCSTIIKKKVVCKRGTYYCENCQK